MSERCFNTVVGGVMACIYVVDDEKDLTWALEKSLSHEGYQVVTASNGLEALRLMRRRRPDLVILDVVMPQMNGMEVCRRLRADPILSAIPILFLTVQETVEQRIEGFLAGCDDYLAKPFDLTELKLRIKALLHRSKLWPHDAPPTHLTVGSLTLDLRTFTVSAEEKSPLLTPTEFDLLYSLMSHTGEVVSSQTLLREVWGYPSGTGDPATVRWHVRKLRKKIEPTPDNPIYILTVPRHGYTVSQ